MPIKSALIVLMAAASTAAAAPDRIVGAIDSSRITVLRGQVHPLAQARYDQGLADPAMSISYATLFLKTDASLEGFLKSQPRGQALRPEEFAERFGASQNDVAKITAWLTSQGLQVHDVARGRHWITFSGSAGQVSRALRTEIHRYSLDGQLHFANATEPSIPQALSNVVAGFAGLNDFDILPPVRKPVPEFNTATAHWLAPGDIATIYDIAPLYNAGIDGSGQSIVVVGASDLLGDDVAMYRQLFNLPVNNPEPMLFGADPGFSLGALIEADLDLEVTGAVAPNAAVIYAYSTSIFTAMQYAVDQNLGQVITASYGYCEAGAPLAYRAVVQQANAQGITVLASSGDQGAATCDRIDPTPQSSSGVSVSWPASLPEVTAVGGTEFNEGSGTYWLPSAGLNGGSAKSYIPEVAWNDTTALNTLAASGGGASALYGKPAWQTGPGVPNDNARDIPDISFSGSYYHDPYALVVLGLTESNGGTSASAPLFAGVVALLNQYEVAHGAIAQPGLGNLNPTLYAMAQAAPSAFHDISSGNNAVPCAQETLNCVNGAAGYNAGPGYDLATGLGSLDVYNFVTQWKSAVPSTVTLTLSPASAGLNDPVQVTATVTGAAASPAGTLALVVQAGAAGGVALGTADLTAGATAGTSSAVFNVTGAQLGIGGGTVQAVYGGDALYQASQASASFALKLGFTSGSVVIPWVTPDPVPESTNGQWPYRAGLTEVAGVATTVTGFTVAGGNENLAVLSSVNVPANGTVSASLVGLDLQAPLNRVFVFRGQDPGGQAWTQQISVPFLSNAATNLPAISLTTATPAVETNSSSPANCQWSQQLTLQDLTGVETLLTGMVVTGVSLPGEIQTTFGATRLAPFGSLQGNLCFPLSSGSAASVALDGIAVTGPAAGYGVSANVSATLQPAASGALAQFTSPASGGSYSINTASAAESPSPLAIPVSFSGGSPAWTLSVGPANQATGWLNVSPLSGSGSGSVTVTASPAGLSPGAYTAFLTFASAGALPQTVTVPVTLTVSASSALSIGGLANNFSAGLTAAPGMMTAVYGSNMAPAGTMVLAPGLPLPLSLGGVSATVNGVTAPLYYVSPGQIDLQVPYETSAGTAVLAINNNGQIATFAFPVAVTAPGLYPGAISLAGQPVSSAALSQTLLLYMTGDGDVTPFVATGATPFPQSKPANYPKPRLPVSVKIGGTPAAVLFQAIPNGLAGATQINFTISPNTPLGPQQVVVSVGGVPAPPVPLTVTSQ